MTRDELVTLCRGSMSILDELERGEVASVADRIIDDLVDELRDDPGIPKRSHYDWFVALSDLRCEIEKQLIDLAGDRAQLARLRAMVHAIVDEGRNAP